MEGLNVGHIWIAFFVGILIGGAVGSVTIGVLYMSREESELRERKWDIDRALELINAGWSDQEVSDRVNASIHSIRILRLSLNKGDKRRYEGARGKIEKEHAPNYQAELQKFIEEKAALAGISPEEFKRWMFQTAEGAAYCAWMNRRLYEEKILSCTE